MEMLSLKNIVVDVGGVVEGETRHKKVIIKIKLLFSGKKYIQVYKLNL